MSAQTSSPINLPHVDRQRRACGKLKMHSTVGRLSICPPITKTDVHRFWHDSTRIIAVRVSNVTNEIFTVVTKKRKELSTRCPGKHSTTQRIVDICLRILSAYIRLNVEYYRTQPMMNSQCLRSRGQELICHQDMIPIASLLL